MYSAHYTQPLRSLANEDDVALDLYSQALDLYLGEASAAQADAEWWAEVGQSDPLAALYLLQTLPKRILSLLRAGSFRPSALLTSPSIFFPHLKNAPLGTHVHRVPRDTVRRLANALYFPLSLVRDECRVKHQGNEKLRDERAEILGKLIEMRPALERALSARDRSGRDLLTDFVFALGPGALVEAPGKDSPFDFIKVSKAILDAHKKEHASYLDTRDLRRPSRWTLLWPRVLLLPPLALYCVKTVYASRATLTDLAVDAVETIHNFVTDWLLEPLRGVYRTIRAGGEEGVIVRPEAVSADVASLERMALSLAQDKLGYNEAQLSALSNRIRMGDFTTILEIYEQDIKQPFRSVIAGTLLRSLFVQVQKAKVDLDQTLTGIDKLLKSQELTFAFVGVAPALAVVYVVGGFLRQFIFGARPRYGGKHRRASTWLAMRRIERLLLFQPDTLHEHADKPSSNAIPPLTTGLLVLSLIHLRKYALASLPARSRLREGFIQDVQDLEDPSLGRWEKLRVLDRMWKNWGHELGWYGVR